MDGQNTKHGKVKKTATYMNNDLVLSNALLHHAFEHPPSLTAPPVHSPTLFNFPWHTGTSDAHRTTAYWYLYLTIHH